MAWRAGAGRWTWTRFPPSAACRSSSCWVCPSSLCSPAPAPPGLRGEQCDPADLDLVVLAGAAVFLAAVAVVRLSTRVGLPSLLIHLAIGVGIGEAGLGLGFEDARLTCR